MDAEAINRRRRQKCSTYSSNVSFSASLPRDVRGVFAESICAVQYSIDPVADFQASIIEMIREVGVRNWEEMEELVYCYVVLNSSEMHAVIENAFLSLGSCS